MPICNKCNSYYSDPPCPICAEREEWTLRARELNIEIEKQKIYLDNLRKSGEEKIASKKKELENTKVKREEMNQLIFKYRVDLENISKKTEHFETEISSLQEELEKSEIQLKEIEEKFNSFKEEISNKEAKLLKFQEENNIQVQKLNEMNDKKNNFLQIIDQLNNRNLALEEKIKNLEIAIGNLS